MRSDPLATTGFKVLLIITGVIIFGTPIYYILVVLLGIVAATTILVAIAVFITTRYYLNRRRINKLSADHLHRPTETTRDWPQKYSKNRLDTRNISGNWRRKSEPNSLQRNSMNIFRFTLMPLKFVAHILLSRHRGNAKSEELLHRQTRWSDEIYP